MIITNDIATECKGCGVKDTNNAVILSGDNMKAYSLCDDCHTKIEYLLENMNALDNKDWYSVLPKPDEPLRTTGTNEMLFKAN